MFRINIPRVNLIVRKKSFYFLLFIFYCLIVQKFDTRNPACYYGPDDESCSFSSVSRIWSFSLSAVFFSTPSVGLDDNVRHISFNRSSSMMRIQIVEEAQEISFLRVILSDRNTISNHKLRDLCFALKIRSALKRFPYRKNH